MISYFTDVQFFTLNPKEREFIYNLTLIPVNGSYFIGTFNVSDPNAMRNFVQEQSQFVFNMSNFLLYEIDDNDPFWCYKWSIEVLYKFVDKSYIKETVDCFSEPCSNREK